SLHSPHPKVVVQILKTLEETHLPPHNLQLEITESSLMENPAAAASMFQELEAHSIRLAMDDFGTGYSSLSYLRRFPVHTLKIDRSFTHRLGTQEEDLEIVQSIVSLARSLKMHVIAEGIETEAQLDCLQNIGCDLGQGFLFAKALNTQTTHDFLVEQRSFCP
ncbi:MAG: EAL domain-containing protein, partial [Cyanobacteria bacterium J06639_14]